MHGRATDATDGKCLGCFLQLEMFIQNKCRQSLIGWTVSCEKLQNVTISIPHGCDTLFCLRNEFLPYQGPFHLEVIFACFCDGIVEKISYLFPTRHHFGPYLHFGKVGGWHGNLSIQPVTAMLWFWLLRHKKIYITPS